MTLKMLGGYLTSTASSGRCGFLSGYCFRVDFRIAARRWIPSFAFIGKQHKSVCVKQWVVVLLYSMSAEPWTDKGLAQD